jgi:beta-xylosidase
MRKLFILSALCLSACLASARGTKSGDPIPVPLADPFVIYDAGLYYIYGTGSGDGIPVAVSKDLESWHWPEGKGVYLALHKKDTYGEKFFWAPEVYKVGDKYLMYYSADEHICAAESDSPLGPFVQTVRKPMREHNGIDNHLFIDKDGTPYLFWVHFDNGNKIWVARLDKDLKTLIPGTERFCIGMDQEWERLMPSVNEGPFVLEHKGLYYMTYSANSYESPDYGVGYAVAESPMGPWVKYEGNPVLRRVAGLEGVGHHAFFKDKRGRDRIVFHSHNRPGKIHPRVIHIGSYRFRKVKGGHDRLEIDDKFFTPSML